MQRQSEQSLITRTSQENSRISVNKKPKLKLGLDIILALSIVSLFIILLIISFFISGQQSSIVKPVRVAIPWFADRPIIMQMGTSRVVEALLYSGYDARNLNNFKSVTEREVQWSVNPSGIVSIDNYGRINTIKEGQCILKLVSVANRDVTDQRKIIVVNKRTDIDVIRKRIITFSGGPADTVSNFQKIVQRLSKQQVKSDPKIPQSVKNASLNPAGPFQNVTKDGDIKWQILNFSDGSGRRYIKRTEQSALQKNRDKYQYFIGDRYIPDEGVDPVMIQSDKDNGLWIVGKTGNVNHLIMKRMSYFEKSQMMVLNTEKFVMRNGLASGADWNGQKWVPQIADNDGLWTSMYGAGQLMKYSILKERRANETAIALARQRALKSLKAVLLIANVAGRQGKVQAKIRHLNNTRTGDGVFYSSKYLLKGKPDLRDTYVGRPIDGISFFGVDAGKNISQNYQGGRFRYSMLPIRPEDWAQTGEPATTQRNLDGYMSRSFVIPAIDPPIPGGLFFRRNNNSTHSVLSGAKTLYDYTNNDHPNLQLGNKPIPDVLKDLLFINGVQYNASDLVYKGDTSTDQVIGHLFIYKIAYDILSDNDNQQRQLKQLIRQTLRDFSQHLLNNGYRMVDATGQSTKWTKLYKQFFMSDFTIQDAALKAIQLLMSLKLTYYVTGERKWKDEYDLLANDEKFSYIDFVGMQWDRQVWAFTKCDDLDSKMAKLDYNLNPTDIQIQRHSTYQIHFSDEEEAYLAYYLAFQLEEDPKMRQKYRKGINGYWHSISKSENPLWYFIYQLAYPDKAMNDSYGNDLREIASWQLSRHMIDTRQYQAFIKGSRPDVIFEGPLSVNPHKIVGKRTSKQDTQYVNQTLNHKISPSFDPKMIYQIKALPADERSIHKFNGATFDNIDRNHNPNNMQPATTFTLPYWLGVYHGLIKFD